MSGTINLALSQQFDMDGVPLSGGLLYFFQAGTSTPQNAFQDTGLTILHPNPLVLDASGRVPMFYVASTEPPNPSQAPNGQIKIRLTDKNGVVIIAADNLLVIGPAGGGGGGGAVDATTVLATGDIKARYGIGTLTGFVRCNGNTIGNGVSGATERANADCQALFEYLWSTGVLGVFSGLTPNRGTSATADFTANKNILLPDLRGRTIAGMDDMGAAAASRLTAAGLGVPGTTLGNANTGTVETFALTAGNLPAHTHSLSVTTGSGPITTGSETLVGGVRHTHAGGSLNTDVLFQGTGALALGVQNGTTPEGLQTNAAGNTFYPASSIGTMRVNGSIAAWSGATASGSDHTHNLANITSTGTSGDGSSTFVATPIKNIQPTMVLTFYMKL